MIKDAKKKDKTQCFYSDVQLNRNCPLLTGSGYPTHLGSGARCRIAMNEYLTPSRIDWDADTTYYTD